MHAIFTDARSVESDPYRHLTSHVYHLKCLHMGFPYFQHCSCTGVQGLFFSFCRIHMCTLLLQLQSVSNFTTFGGLWIEPLSGNIMCVSKY
jgi:hypothetical protein